MKQKILLVILTILIVTSLLVSCSGNTGTNTRTNKTEKSSNNTFEEESTFRVFEDDTQIVFENEEDEVVETYFQSSFEQEIPSEPVKDEVVIDYVKYVDDGAFYYAMKEHDSITGDIEIAGEIKSKPVRVKTFGFENTAIRSVTLKNGVEEIEELAFSGCKNLKEFLVEDTNEFFAAKDGVLYSKDLKTIIQYPTGKNYDTILIGEEIEQIRPGALEVASVSQVRVALGNNSFIEEEDILFNSDRTELHFYSAHKTNTSYEIPNTVIKILANAFTRCANLINLELPSTLTDIGAGAFNHCSALTQIEIPIGVTQIKAGTFYNCSQLAAPTIHENVTEIGKSAFEGCSSFNTLVIPNNVTSIGQYAFYRCSSIESLTVPFIGNNKLQNQNNYLGYVFGALDPVENKTKVPQSLKNITITNQSTSILQKAFKDCMYLENITMNQNANITNIGQEAFANCRKISSIVIPDAVTQIGKNAFDGCYSLETINIGSSVTSIAKDAFLNSSNIKNVNITDVNKFIDINFENKFSNPIWRDGVLKKDNVAVTEITIPSDRTEIKPYSLINATNLVKVTIPDSVTSIGEYAFANCSSLSNVTIPAAVTNIGKGAFTNTAIETVTIPSGVQEIKQDAFSNCIRLKTVNFAGNNCTTISDKAFYNCKQLKNITLPDTVTSINNYAFFACQNLELINIPANVSNIGLDAFAQCSNLKDVKIDSANIFANQTDSTANGSLCSIARIKNIYVNNSINSTASTYLLDTERFTFSATSSMSGYKVYSKNNL